jgi:hypothetical protein
MMIFIGSLFAFEMRERNPSPRQAPAASDLSACQPGATAARLRLN